MKISLFLDPNMKKSTLTFILPVMLVLWNTSLFGQDETDAHSFDHHHKHHELALGTGLGVMPGESSFGFGFHLHGIAGINEWLGVGPGYELIAGEHIHHTVTGLLHFHPFHPLDLNIGPGLVFPDGEHQNFRFKLHAEVAAVFEASEHLHLGPSIDAGIGKEDLHFTFGIHIGYIFE
jgi:hypothetical protein